MSTTEQTNEQEMCERVYFLFSFFLRLTLAWFGLSHKSVHSQDILLHDTGNKDTHTHSGTSNEVHELVGGEIYYQIGMMRIQEIFVGSCKMCGAGT